MLALDRLGSYFAGRTSRSAWFARRLLHRADPGDPALRKHLITGLTGAIRPDGSLPGGMLPTALALKDLVQLDAGPATIGRPLDWLMNLQNKPGAFHEGCTAARHAHRVCEHFLAGFFSPAPPTQRVAPLSLPSGKTYRIESQARFSLSCLALEAVVLAGRAGESLVIRHLDSFIHLLPEWAAWNEDFLPPDLAFGVLSALAGAPDRYRETIEGLVTIVAANQQPDGTWSRAEFFAALEALGQIPSPSVIPILERALPALLQRQRDGGSFGSVSQDERALVALRVLLRLATPSSTPATPSPA